MYIIEGIIGAGKSTLIQLLERNFSFLKTFQEPVDQWQNLRGDQSLLTNFYEDPHRWAYTLETCTLMSRTQDHVRFSTIANQIPIFERSIYSGYYCFARHSYEQGFLTDMEWHIYIQWFSIISTICRPPNGFIYLQVDPLIAFKRIQKRGRPSEKSLPLNYIKSLTEKHDEFLIEKKINHFQQSIPVLVINGNNDFENNPETSIAICEQIQNYINTTLHL